MEYLKQDLIHPLSWQANGGAFQSTSEYSQIMNSFTYEVVIDKYPESSSSAYLFGDTNSDFYVILRGNERGPTAYFRGPDGLILSIPHLIPCKHYVVTFNNGIANIYANGVKVITEDRLNTIQRVDNTLGSGLMRKEAVINTYRIYNAALTDIQVKELFNWGRCSEVVIGDEWKQNTLLSTSGNLVAYGGIRLYARGVISNDFTNSKFMEVSISINTALPLSTSCKIYQGTSSGSFNSSETITLIKNGNNYIYKGVIQSQNYPNIGVNELINSDGVTPLDINAINFNMSVSTVDVLNEYIPSYLTPNLWFDNGVSKQHLTSVNSQFTEINYKDYNTPIITSSTDPNKKPDFIGQKWINETTKSTFQANGLELNNWLIL